VSGGSFATGLGPTRARVLAALREADGPRGAAEVAAALGLHSNGARFHLEALVGAGLAERTAEDRSARGRPRVLYAAAAGAREDGEGDYRVLAGILSTALATQAPSPAAAAEAAGADHGRRLVTPAGGRGGRGTQPSEPVQAVVEAMGRMGFRSRAVPAGSAGRIDITPCPFLDLARAHDEVVCSVHRGLMSGMLSVLDSSLTVERLEPFATPHLCVARLGRAPAPTEAAPAMPA
jgi:predicted ArsR family transcriptional regulator